MKVQANGITIEVEDTGAGHGAAARQRPVVLLVMGLGMQLVAWPDEFVQALVDAGYRVVRFDNRDIGLSQHFDQFGRPNMVWEFMKLKLGLQLTPAYSLADMAADTLGVMDAMHIARAHVVGVSMGGMIAQHLVLAAPGRVLSLASIMSSSGAPGLPGARASVLRVMLSRPAGDTPEDVLNYYVRLYRAIASPGFETTQQDLVQRIRTTIDRNYHPDGTLRQMVAISADTQRAELLSRIRTPTLVLHGRADPLVPFPCGEDTARRIQGSHFVAVDGMGHDLAPGVVARMQAELLPFLAAHAEGPRQIIAS